MSVDDRIRLLATGAALLLAGAVGCGAAANLGDQSTPADMASGTRDGTGGVDLVSATIPDGGAGNSIMGGVNGSAFNSASNALFLGAPDDPTTTVVYLFSTPIACADLAMTAWDGRVSQKAQILEMKAFGSTPNVYTVTTSLTPAAGEASVNYTLAHQEFHGSKGTVTLKTVTSNTLVTGTFDLDFGGGDKLAGAFTAPFCPEGHEP